MACLRIFGAAVYLLSLSIKRSFLVIGGDTASQKYIYILLTFVYSAPKAHESGGKKKK